MSPMSEFMTEVSLAHSYQELFRVTGPLLSAHSYPELFRVTGPLQSIVKVGGRKSEMGRGDRTRYPKKKIE
jgi:hypothetical protein